MATVCTLLVSIPPWRWQLWMHGHSHLWCLCCVASCHSWYLWVCILAWLSHRLPGHRVLYCRDEAGTFLQQDVDSIPGPFLQRLLHSSHNNCLLLSVVFFDLKQKNSPVIASYPDLFCDWRLVPEKITNEQSWLPCRRLWCTSFRKWICFTHMLQSCLDNYTETSIAPEKPHGLRVFRQITTWWNPWVGLLWGCPQAHDPSIVI